MENYLMEELQVKVGTGPIDLDAGNNVGARIDMKQFARVTFIAFAGAGTTPSSHTFSFKQHTAASAGTTAVLSHANPYYHRLGTATSFTKVQPSSAADAYDLDTLVGDAKYVVVFEVLSEDLTDGYEWVSLDQTDAGGAQLGGIIALGHKASNKPAYDKVI